MGEHHHQNRTGSIKIKPDTGSSNHCLPTTISPVAFSPVVQIAILNPFCRRHMEQGSISWKSISTTEFVFEQPQPVPGRAFL